MKCTKCGSENVELSVVQSTKSVSRSFLWNLLMLCITFGLWLVWMLVRKKKEKIVQSTVALCKDCGNHWEIKDEETLKKEKQEKLITFIIFPVLIIMLVLMFM